MAFVKMVGYDEFNIKLSLPVGERSVGVYGQWHLQYLQEHRRLAYTNLLTSEKLNQYLCEIDE